MTFECRWSSSDWQMCTIHLIYIEITPAIFIGKLSNEEQSLSNDFFGALCAVVVKAIK